MVLGGGEGGLPDQTARGRPGHQAADGPADGRDVIEGEAAGRFAEGEGHHRGDVAVVQARIDDVHRHRRVQRVDAELHLAGVRGLRVAGRVLGARDRDADRIHVDVGVGHVVGRGVDRVAAAPRAAGQRECAVDSRAEGEHRGGRAVSEHGRTKGDGQRQSICACICIGDEGLAGSHTYARRIVIGD